MKKIINQQEMKRSNTADVFKLIRDCGTVTRRQIAASTNLSWGAVSGITARLLDCSYITECKASSPPGAGRTPSALEVNTAEHFAVGIDVNATGLRSCLINLKNEVIDTLTKSVDFSDRDTLLDGIYSFIEETVDRANGHHVLCIGIAMQGKVDSENGISIALPMCKSWQDVPLAYLISKRFGIPTYIRHDPDCILYEHAMTTEITDSILLRIDKGIGMAVMLDGKPIDKPGMFEIGHLTVEPDGEPCGCGKRGCLCAYASQSGIEKRSGRKISELSLAASNKNGEEARYFDDASRYLALAITNTALLFNIYNVTLCGEMMLRKELFWDSFTSYIAKFAPDSSFNFSFADVTGASLGAAMNAIEHTLDTFDVITE